MTFATTTRLTADEARQWFAVNGVPIKEWARARGFSETLTYSVLAGRSKCVRGQAHEIAVALGLKQAPKAPPSQLLETGPAGLTHHPTNR